MAEEKDLIALPDELSYGDGAQVACGFGTVYEGLEKIGINGNHAVLITGLGPVGLAAGALCRKLGAQKIIGIDVVPERMEIALNLGLCDAVLASGPDNVAEVKQLTRGMGVERAVDCSANDAARATAIRATRKWGRIVFLGEGGRVEFNPSPDMIHDQKDALRLVGHLDVADGRAGGAAGALESASGRNHHPQISAGARQRGLCADGLREMRQSGGVCGRRIEMNRDRGQQLMTVAPGITKPDWKGQLKALLPLFGHRNWIVVADSAYPAQSRAGIDTIVSGAGQIEVARKVLDAIAASKHVRANIYLDQELQFVAESDAPGVSRYRTQLAELFKIAKTITLPHEQIICQARPDRADLSRAHHQDRVHDSIHLNLFRTRLRLLERRSGTTTPASDGCFRYKARSAVVQLVRAAQLNLLARTNAGKECSS